MSALGFYPVTPGTDQYVFGSPLFNKATLKFENGRQLVIEAPDNSRENFYVQSISLNNKITDKNFITHNQLLKGGKLEFRMGPEPESTRGINISSRPFSMSLE